MPTSLPWPAGWAGPDRANMEMESEDPQPNLKRPSVVLFIILLVIVLAALGIEFLLGLIPGLF